MPTDDHAAPTERVADLVAIAALQSRYADVVSRQAFGELDELFVPDIRLSMELPGHTKELVGPHAFGEYVGRRIAHLEFFQFVVDNAVVERGDDPHRASGRLWFHELHQDREQHRLVRLHGVYRDDFVQLDGRWWFAARRFAPLAMTSNDPTRDLDVFPDPFTTDG